MAWKVTAVASVISRASRSCTWLSRSISKVTIWRMVTDMSSNSLHQSQITPWGVSIMSILRRKDLFKMRKICEICVWRRASRGMRTRQASLLLIRSITTRSRLAHLVITQESLQMEQSPPTSVAALHSLKIATRKEILQSHQLKMVKASNKLTLRKIWIEMSLMAE